MLLSSDGRVQDGYIAWSSIYLHEYFGFTIYTPLTPEEEQDLKKPQGAASIPRWMYEFTSLPNLAIFMSYFCIGVALQLLRTPLIVYFIEDLLATPAEVNVLFTGTYICMMHVDDVEQVVRPSDLKLTAIAFLVIRAQSWQCHGASKSSMASLATVCPSADSGGNLTL
jgi:hypothetical protein